MKVAAYCRVSTSSQDHTNQRPQLLQLAAARGWEVEWHEEVASGARARPVLEQLTTRCRRGEYPVLLVWAIDRLGRSMQDTVQRVLALDVSGCRVVSYSEPWLDFGGPVRPLLLSIFAWVAEQERSRLRERVNAGLARARSNGTRLGRPKASPLALAAAAAVYEAGGLSLDAAAERYGVSGETLRRHLRAAPQ